MCPRRKLPLTPLTPLLIANVQKHWDDATLEERVIGYLKRVARPAYMGSIAVELGQSLKRTSKVLEGMVDAGTVRYVTQDEKKGMDTDPGSVMCVLVDI